MARFSFKVIDTGARGKLNALIKATADMQPVYATVGRVVANRIRLCFKLGIDPWGSPWAKLRFRSGQPLRDTGRLQRSIVAKPDGKGVTIGTNVRYARTHQYGATIVPKEQAGPVQPGGSIGGRARLVFPGPVGRLIFAKKVTIPARPFMPLRKNQSVVALPVDWSADVVRALRAYFVNVAKGT